MTKQQATKEAQELADLTGDTVYIYWQIYGCYWSVHTTRKSSGANVGYEEVFTPRNKA